jgi:antitoxin (DNA-binding transcriptional repressor) of toxin-antitoxin stability system
MNEPISTHVAKTHLSLLIARAEAGEEIIIARGRKPVPKLVPTTPKAERVFGALKGKLSIGPEFFEPLLREELESWEQGPLSL